MVYVLEMLNVELLTISYLVTKWNYIHSEEAFFGGCLHVGTRTKCETISWLMFARLIMKIHRTQEWKFAERNAT